MNKIKNRKAVFLWSEIKMLFLNQISTKLGLGWDTNHGPTRVRPMDSSERTPGFGLREWMGISPCTHITLIVRFALEGKFLACSYSDPSCDDIMNAMVNDWAYWGQGHILCYHRSYFPCWLCLPFYLYLKVPKHVHVQRIIATLYFFINFLLLLTLAAILFVS